MSKESNVQQAPIWMGLIAIAVGVLPIALGAEPTAGTPMWVVYAACSVFIFAGLAIIFPRLASLIGPLIVVTFACIATWIGFAPGERQCTGSFSLPFWTETKSTGCGAFGVSAVILWIIIALLLITSIVKLFKPKR